MAVFRVERTRDYTVMCNHHLKDSNLSLKAKGLLSMMLSLPDEWNYTTRGLAAICKEGVDAIGKTLKELELAGYIIRHRNHRVHAALDLVLAIVCLLGGVALYYLGMLYDHFTIHDFWQIRVPGWVGLVLAAIVIVVLFVQNIGKAAARRRSEKEAARAEDARRKELEEAKSAAFASGQAAAASAQPDPQEKTEEKPE